MLSGSRVLRISLPLFAVLVVSASLVVILRPHVQYEGIIDDVSAWGSFFNVFGVIYAIVAGFLLVTVINRYSSLSQTIEDELNAIESVRDFLVYFESNQRESVHEMRASLFRYNNCGCC